MKYLPMNPSEVVKFRIFSVAGAVTGTVGYGL